MINDPTRFTPGMWKESGQVVENRPMLTISVIGGCTHGPVYQHLIKDHAEMALELADTKHAARQVLAAAQALTTTKHGLPNFV